MFAYPLTWKGEEAHNYAAGPGVGPVRPIFALPYMTPLHRKRHNMIIHIIHTVPTARVSETRLNSVTEVPSTWLGQMEAKVAS